MKLRTRLSVILGVMLVASGVLIGGASAWLSRADAVNRIDTVLGGITERIATDPSKDVETLLASAETSPFPLIGQIFFDNADPFSVVEGRNGDRVLTLPALSLATVMRATDHPVTIDGQVALRIRAAESGTGQWIVVGTSLRAVNSQFTRSLLQSLGVSAAIALLTVLVVWLILRRELRPITHVTESATAIAAGDLGVELPLSARTNEVGELTAALRAMTNKLQEAVTITSLSEQRMREFLGDASHELRTPLTVVRGYVDILFGGRQLSEEQRERAIRRLVSESKRMDVIINDLLLLAELGEVHIPIDDHVDFSRIVADHFTDLKMQQAERKVIISVEPILTVMGNAAHLERLVTNIKSNILRHTGPDTEVHVSLAQVDENIVLEVDDAGPGLPLSVYERSTAEFQRFDHARSQDGGGFGLGLSIIASIVHLHGGTLELSPSSLGGLRTRVVLPAVAAI
ncbi:MAG: HAMP domain-containing sensor histidine kinase [Ilumatobacteraceae bacterium]